MKFNLYFFCALFLLTACDNTDSYKEHNQSANIKPKLIQTNFPLNKQKYNVQTANKNEVNQNVSNVSVNNLSPKQTKTELSKLEKIGIEVNGSKIIIDTNQTKEFLKELGTKFESKIKKIQSDIKNGMVRDKNAGIEITNTKINIDLNKTKGFLENWGNKVEDIFKSMTEATETVAK